MTVHDTLVAARETLSDPGRWAKGWFAFDDDWRTVDATSPDACRWCLAGAIQKACHYRAGDAAGRKLYRASLRSIRVASGFLGSFNDSPQTTHIDILRVLDKAIEATK